MAQPIPASNLQLISPAFSEGQPIPVQYTCKGDNVSPPLSIAGVPGGAKSLVLIMHDPDAPGTDFVHWTIWDMAANTENIASNSVPVGAVQGLTSFGGNKYGGPCPPSGTHHYKFELYALGKTLNLKPESTRDQLEDAMGGHVLGHYTLTGTVTH